MAPSAVRCNDEKPADQRTTSPTDTSSTATSSKHADVPELQMIASCEERTPAAAAVGLETLVKETAKFSIKDAPGHKTSDASLGLHMSCSKTADGSRSDRGKEDRDVGAGKEDAAPKHIAKDQQGLPEAVKSSPSKTTTAAPSSGLPCHSDRDDDDEDDSDDEDDDDDDDDFGGREQVYRGEWDT